MAEEIKKILDWAKDVVQLAVGILTIAVLAKQLSKPGKTEAPRKRKRR